MSRPPPAGSGRGSPGWDALLAEFRALGGTAENVTLRQGARGRGVFPVDRTKPVRLYVPPNLLVPSGETEIRDGQFLAKASAALGERERAFFDRYQRDFSWGAGTFDDLWQMQLAWCRLPQELKLKLREIAGLTGDRFSEPSEDMCRKRYLGTRQIAYRDVPVLMPIVELVNHSGMAASFESKDGIAVSGTFEGEVLADYSFDDCWGTAVIYGFCDAHPHALSLPLALKSGDVTVTIARTFGQTETVNGLPMPILRVEGNSVHFPWLMLGTSRRPRLPRAFFLQLVQETPIKRPDELFDIIQHHNRMRLLSFLRVSESSAMPLVATLRSAALQQLETLSHYWGTRSLEAGPAGV